MNGGSILWSALVAIIFLLVVAWFQVLQQYFHHITPDSFGGAVKAAVVWTIFVVAVVISVYVTGPTGRSGHTPVVAVF